MQHIWTDRPNQHITWQQKYNIITIIASVRSKGHGSITVLLSKVCSLVWKLVFHFLCQINTSKDETKWNLPNAVLCIARQMHSGPKVIFAVCPMGYEIKGWIEVWCSTCSVVFHELRHTWSIMKVKSWRKSLLMLSHDLAASTNQCIARSKHYINAMCV